MPFFRKRLQAVVSEHFMDPFTHVARYGNYFGDPNIRAVKRKTKYAGFKLITKPPHNYLVEVRHDPNDVSSPDQGLLSIHVRKTGEDEDLLSVDFSRSRTGLISGGMNRIHAKEIFRALFEYAGNLHNITDSKYDKSRAIQLRNYERSILARIIN